MAGWKTIAAVAVLTAGSATAGNAWFWEAERNTVKAYEDCLKRNASEVTPIGDIKIACAKKTAAPIPLDQVTVEYWVKQNRSLAYGHEQMSYMRWERLAFVRSNDYLLSDVVVRVTFPQEAPAEYSALEEPRHQLNVTIDGSKGSLERYEAACTEKRKTPGVNTCGAELFSEPDEPTIACDLKHPQFTGCVKVEVVSAKGLKVVID